jgi:hypothetical protein
MKRVLLALLVGLAAGYHWGYDDGSGGTPSVVSRTLDRFGASQVRAAQAADDRRIEEAGKP